MAVRRRVFVKASALVVATVLGLCVVYWIRTRNVDQRFVGSWAATRGPVTHRFELGPLGQGATWLEFAGGPLAPVTHVTWVVENGVLELRTNHSSKVVHLLPDDLLRMSDVPPYVSAEDYYIINVSEDEITLSTSPVPTRSKLSLRRIYK